MLPIGRPGVAALEKGQIMDLRSGRPSSVNDIVAATEGKRFLFLGESHTNPAHHQFQADCITALCRAGRPVVVGFEMFTRPVQSDLDPWTMGWWDEPTFQRESDWQHQWGYDYSLYRPIFEAVRANRVPMVALNIPRPWVRAVGKGGFAALTPEQRKELPNELGKPNPAHRQVFDSMMSGHAMTGTNMDNMYAAQVLWDEAMADSALRYLESRPVPPNAVFVVLAGSGHVAYGQGINWRLAQRHAEPGVTVVMVDADATKVTVSRGLADFVFCGGEPKG